MQEKEKQLKQLISESSLSKQLILNKIVQAMQRTCDYSIINKTKESILEGNCTGIKERTMDDLIRAFSIPGDKKEIKEEPIKEEIKKEVIEESTNNKELNLAYELEKMKDRYEIELQNNKDNQLKIDELNNTVSKLSQSINILDRFELIIVPEEEIKKQYIEFLNGDDSDSVIQKEYYKTRR